MLRLSCNILITNPDNNQKVRFNYISEIEAICSVKNFTDTAKIVVPRKLAYKGKNITEYIKRNHTIIIQIGYDDNLETVFKGYVKNVSTGTPLTIECENEAFKLKQIKVEPVHFPSLNIQDFCKEYMTGYTCIVPSINLGEFRINQGVTLAGVFEYFMKNYPISFYFRDDVFYGILPGAMTVIDDAVKTVKYKIGYNTISDNLTYTLAEDVKVQIVAKAITKDNIKLEWAEPQNTEGADVRTFFVPGATTVDELKKYAQDKIKEFKIDKMTGDITAFGLPYVRKGDVAHIIDEDNTERHNKKFWIEQAAYTFGQGGYRIKSTLGGQLNG